MQAVVATTVARLVGLDVAGPTWALLVVAVLVSVLGTALGLLASAFAATELQAVQFMPAFVLPQLLLCGLLRPRDDLPTGLSELSSLLPLSHAVDAVDVIAVQPDAGSDLLGPVLGVVGFSVAAWSPVR